MMRRLALAGFGLLFLSVTACVPRAPAPAPAPPPAPPPRPQPPTPPPAPPSPPPTDWQGAPLSPGDWTYRGEGIATFGAGGQPAFTIRCDGDGRIALARSGAGGRSITVRTTFGERSLPAIIRGGEAAAVLAASDPLLDQIAFSRGRFLVQADGAAPLILPAWAEAARAIEDCRG